MILRIVLYNFYSTFAFYRSCYDPRLFDYGGYGVSFVWLDLFGLVFFQLVHP